MMSDLFALIESKPAVEEVKPKVAALKNKYIDIYVSYGKQSSPVTHPNTVSRDR